MNASSTPSIIPIIPATKQSTAQKALTRSLIGGKAGAIAIILAEFAGHTPPPPPYLRTVIHKYLYEKGEMDIGHIHYRSTTLYQIACQFQVLGIQARPSTIDFKRHFSIAVLIRILFLRLSLLLPLLFFPLSFCSFLSSLTLMPLSLLRRPSFVWW